MAKKELKVHFCPKCRSGNVGYVFRFRNAFGMLPRMQCKSCNFQAIAFPLAVIDKSKIKKQEIKNG
jgi:hypothetical protein